MKKNLYSVLFVAWFAASAQANLIPDGSFEANTNGTTVSSGSGNFADSTTITGWRVTDGNAASDTFSATIVPTTDRNPGAGTNALRLAINNNSDIACWVDQGGANQPTPVSYGKTYLFSFDAAWVSGGTFDNIWVGIKEFDSSGTFIVRDQINLGFHSIVSTNFTTYSYTWTPTATNCAGMCPIFYPEATRTNSATLDLDNVVLTTVSSPDEAIAFGHFQGVAPGTSVSQTTDNTTIPSWEVYDDNPGADFFTATIITNNDPYDITPGAHAIQLAITNNSDIACSLKSAVSIPASYGTTYFVSFDAARVAGDDGTAGNNMWVGVFEYDSSGNSLNRPGLVGGGNGFMTVVATNYTTFAYEWTPDDPNCASIKFIFYPEGTFNKTMILNLANITFESSKKTPNLAINTASFNNAAQGTSISNTIDSSTIPGWRLYDNNPVDDFFSATIIPNTDPNDVAGRTNAIELAVYKTGSDNGLQFDQWYNNQQTPVSYGTTYYVSFDAAFASGSSQNLWVGLWEFDSSNNYLYRDQWDNAGWIAVSSSDYTTYSYVWTPTDPGCTRMGYLFYPLCVQSGSQTLNLANFVLTTRYVNQMANVEVSSSANPSLDGQPVTFTATVSGTGGTPEGSVIFSSPAGPFSTNSLSGGSATSLAITNLPAGTNLITATYNDYLGGANTLNQVVKNIKFTGIVSGNPTTLTALGVPEYYYILERATNLAPAVWVDVQTNQATISGVITASDHFSDLGSQAPKSAFYRLKWNGN